MIDIGNLTSEQTKQLAIACLANLSIEDQIDAIKDALTEVELDELAANIE